MFTNFGGHCFLLVRSDQVGVVFPRVFVVFVQGRAEKPDIQQS